MSDDRDQRVKERAYELWESEGRPSGRHDMHWDQARREIERRDRERAAGMESPPVESPGRRPAARRKTKSETGRQQKSSAIRADAKPGFPPASKK